MNGEIKHLTGLNSVYEAPRNPDIQINTENDSVNISAARIMEAFWQEYW